MERISRRLPIMFLLFACIFHPSIGQHNLLFATVQSPREKDAQVLYKRFLENYKGNADALVVANQAAKEYLQKYSDINANVTDYLKRWIDAYERDLQQWQAQQAQRQITPRTPPLRPPSLTFEQEPELGMALPGKPPKSFSVIFTGAPAPDPNTQGQWLGSGMLSAGFAGEWAGIKGLIGADTKKWVITYILTSDPAFKTPEGLKVGDSAEKALKVSKIKAIKENDYVFSVKLQSGWYARFIAQADYDAKGKLITIKNATLRPEMKVIEFYKKPNVQSAVKETIVGTVIAESTSITPIGDTISRRLVVHVREQGGRKPIDEFIIVRNVSTSVRDKSQPADPRNGVRMINGPNLSRADIELKQPLELKLTRDESCDATLESISYVYIGVMPKDGQRRMEPMPDLRYVLEEDIKRIPKNAKLPCYVLQGADYKVVKK